MVKCWNKRKSHLKNELFHIERFFYFFCEIVSRGSSIDDVMALGGGENIFGTLKLQPYYKA